MADSRKFRSEEWFQERFGNVLPEVDPNFDTSNCPDDDFFASLLSKRKKPSLFDPRTSHVLDCPHCMRKAMLMRERATEQKLVTMRRIWVPALAFCVFLAAATLWIVRDRGFQSYPQQALPMQQTVDLSSYGTYRGGGFHPQETISLPASVVTATIVLPRLSDPGKYFVAVDRNRESNHHLAQASANTISQEGQQVLTVKLDLHAVNPGMYFLATTQQENGTTYYYPLEIGRPKS